MKSFLSSSSISHTTWILNICRLILHLALHLYLFRSNSSIFVFRSYLFRSSVSNHDEIKVKEEREASFASSHTAKRISEVSNLSFCTIVSLTKKIIFQISDFALNWKIISVPLSNIGTLQHDPRLPHEIICNWQIPQQASGQASTLRLSTTLLFISTYIYIYIYIYLHFV